MAKRKSLCGKCTGLCCRYMALPIDTPQDRDDYDDVRWYLCHEDVTIFVEDGSWYINVKNKCKYLSGKDHLCLIYDERPKICRGYKHNDCDLTEGEYDYELHFNDAQQMAEYIKIKFDNNKKEKPKKSKKKK